MKLFLKLFVIVSLFLSTLGIASASYIVDTGVVSGSGGLALGGFHWIAAEFDISVTTTISSVESFLHSGTGTATVAIYTDGGSIPGTEIYSGVITTTYESDWDGIYGQSWSLAAGTYWAAFEVRDGQTYSGHSWRPDTPLVNYAYASSDETWYSTNSQISLRIESVGSVPEPATVVLFGLGIVGFSAVSRKKNNTDFKE